MNSNPLISVIIPNYNHAQYLQQRLNTVFDQTYQNIEVIILDDCSNDDSLTVIESFRSHSKISHLVVNEKNGGTSIRQWKKGIELAKGEWIWIAESDDFSKADFLLRMMHFAKMHPHCGLIYCQTNDVDSAGNMKGNRINYTKKFENNIWEKDFESEADVFIRSFMKVKNVIPNASAVIFRKSLVEPHKDFSGGILKMRYAADWLFWMRLIRKTKVGFISETMNFFRDHETTTRKHDSRKKLRKRLMEEIKIRKELYDWYPDILQNEEWEIIYAKWFSIQSRFSWIFPDFLFPRQEGTSVQKYLSKYFQYKRRKV